jgi:hypothetical protein
MDTIFIANLGLVIIPERNTAEDILNIVEAMKGDMDALRNFLPIKTIADMEEDKNKDKNKGKEKN